MAAFFRVTGALLHGRINFEGLIKLRGCYCLFYTPRLLDKEAANYRYFTLLNATIPQRLQPREASDLQLASVEETPRPQATSSLAIVPRTPSTLFINIFFFLLLLLLLLPTTIPTPNRPHILFLPTQTLIAGSASAPRG